MDIFFKGNKENTSFNLEIMFLQQKSNFSMIELRKEIKYNKFYGRNKQRKNRIN